MWKKAMMTKQEFYILETRIIILIRELQKQELELEEIQVYARHLFSTIENSKVEVYVSENTLRSIGIRNRFTKCEQPNTEESSKFF